MPLANGQYLAPTFLTGFITEDGQPASNRNLNGDYSVVPLTASYNAPAGFLVNVKSIQLTIGNIGNLNQGGYGSLAALPVGWLLQSQINGVITPFTPDRVTTNNEVITFAGGVDVQIINFSGNQDTISAAFQGSSINDNENAGILLNGNTGDQLQLLLNDDFTGLMDHTFSIGALI